jgi:hypothetical protein
MRFEDAELLRGNFGVSCLALGAGNSWNIRIRDGFESCHFESGNDQKESKSYSAHCWLHNTNCERRRDGKLKASYKLVAMRS